MLVDIVEIKVKGGKGGRGMVSFRREKFVPFGGPYGGDGGDGGSVILVAEPHQRTLAAFKSRKFVVAQNGGAGGNKKMSGKSGADRLVPVPAGTMVYEKKGEEKIIMGDLSTEGERVIVAKGGRGGRGNAHFATPTRQAPEIAEPGEPGEERELLLELKLIADVGIVGKPNAGKSTLINISTKAKPKIASYPFTTTEPVLGVVDVGWGVFTIAEIPGLIEGAHLGRGLGLEFLRHAERTKLLLHLIDGSATDPAQDWAQVNEEVLLYSPEMAAKEQITVINKIDIPSVKEGLKRIKKQLKDVKTEVYYISAATGEGVPELMKEVAKRLHELENRQDTEKTPLRVFRPVPVDVKEPES
mgnify:CR=1 FL=1